MSWIKTLSYDESEGLLRFLYDRIKGPDNYIDNILLVHSLRPHTLEGHMSLYKSVLHHSKNTIPTWYLESIGVYTSMLNNCDYCIDHHLNGLARVLDDEYRFGKIRAALADNDLKSVFNNREAAAFTYTRILTLEPASMTQDDISAMRDAGWDDAEILEINQVVSYFNYANRTVLGLGVTTDGDILGLSPRDSSDPDNWAHH